MTTVELSIIIVNWNTCNLLRQCLKSIYQITENINFEVFVVDNASSDKSVQMVQNEFPQVKIIANKKNLGFAKANNQAIKQSQGEYILLLNPDTIVLSNAISKSINFLKNNPKVGILGCKILNPDNTWQPSCRTFPTIISQIVILLKLHNLFPHLIKKYLMLEMDENKIQEVDQVMGAFFLIKKEVIEKIGYLDDKYWIWFEEVDFCQRAKRAGFKTYYFPEAQIIHYKAQSFNQVLPLKKQWHFNLSLLRYLWKFHSIFGFIAILLLFPFSLLLSFIWQIMQRFLPIKKKKYL